MSDTPIIFISCGQRTQEEKQIGNNIYQLVKELTPYEPFFAQEETNFKGLTEHIFDALDRCVGFIGVLHKRESISTKKDLYRISIFIEQEIAIQAFLEHKLKRNINAIFFREKEVCLEGMREHIMINSHLFENTNEIINKLKEILPQWKNLKPQLPKKSISISLQRKDLKIESKRHDYKLIVVVTNTGKIPIKIHSVEVEFPKLLVDSQMGNPYLKGIKNNYPNICIFQTSENFTKYGKKLLPGKSIDTIFIQYYVDTGIYRKFDTIKDIPAKATVYPDDEDLEPITIEENIRKLQIF